MDRRWRWWWLAVRPDFRSSWRVHHFFLLQTIELHRAMSHVGLGKWARVLSMRSCLMGSHLLNTCPGFAVGILVVESSDTIFLYYHKVLLVWWIKINILCWYICELCGSVHMFLLHDVKLRSSFTDLWMLWTCCRGHTSTVWAVSFNADGDRMVSCRYTAHDSFTI